MEVDNIEVDTHRSRFLEQIDAEPQSDFKLTKASALKTEKMPANISESSSTLAENSEAVPKRKRGRPKREEARPVESIEPRFNPYRAVRNRRSNALVSSESEELMSSRSAKNNVERTQRKIYKKRSCVYRHRQIAPKPRGRPKKEIQKPVCVVKPMQQTGNENKPRKCGWLSCSHVATSVRNLKSHVEREHLNHLSQFVCRWDTCGRTASFKALYMLSLHLRSHIGDRPYECRVCGKTYTRQENLRTHTRMHNQDRPFKCSVCQKGFTSSSDKAKHQKRTHSNMKHFKCPMVECGKKYTDPSSLRKHCIKAHGDDFYRQAKRNKQLNGPGGDYGIIGSTATPDQPSTSRDAETL